MAMRINTNVSALNAQAQSAMNSRSINTSLERLSSGLRINKAADDASGMAIADSLRSQGNALGQAIKNANDGIGIIQTADKAMDEQIKILDTIKTKATQAAQDGQTTETRKALQQDIVKLMDELDNIAGSTSFNGQQLLSGQYTNKKFQIGGYSNETVGVNIGATSSDKVGNVRYETTGNLNVSGGANQLKAVTLKFVDVDGKNDISLESVKISTSAGTGLGALAEVINKNSDRIGGVRASVTVQGTGGSAVAAGNVKGLQINGIEIGNISGVKENDSDGRLVNAINQIKDRTGVEASIDEQGRLNLKSVDGRAIQVKTTSASTVLGGSSGSFKGASGTSTITGRLTLTRLDSRDIKISGTNTDAVGITSGSGSSAKMVETVVNLRDVKGSFSKAANAAGAYANATQSADASSSSALGAGVTSLKGAMMVMDIAEAATKVLDRIRSDLGSTQNQLTSTVNNISITKVNVQAAESQIRDVDFAEESSNFSKYNILAQSGSYAMSQANSTQQNVLRLLQ